MCTLQIRTCAAGEASHNGASTASSTTTTSASATATTNSSAATSATDLVLQFVVPEFKTHPGSHLALVGSVVQLGSWDAAKALAMEWQPGHKWTAQLPLDHAWSGRIEYKVWTGVWDQGGRRGCGQACRDGWWSGTCRCMWMSDQHAARRARCCWCFLAHAFVLVGCKKHFRAMCSCTAITATPRSDPSATPMALISSPLRRMLVQVILVEGDRATWEPGRNHVLQVVPPKPRKAKKSKQQQQQQEGQQEEGGAAALSGGAAGSGQSDAGGVPVVEVLCAWGGSTGEAQQVRRGAEADWAGESTASEMGPHGDDCVRCAWEGSIGEAQNVRKEMQEHGGDCASKGDWVGRFGGRQRQGGSADEEDSRSQQAGCPVAVAAGQLKGSWAHTKPFQACPLLPSITPQKVNGLHYRLCKHHLPRLPKHIIVCLTILGCTGRAHRSLAETGRMF